MDKLGISLLYVEDEEYIRQNMYTSLKRRVETVYSAVNGEDGLAKFKEYEPDLVITDIKMPVMNGLEMIKEIRLLKESTKIIMLSAHSDTTSLLESIEIGVNGYVLKPFQTSKLYRLIENLAKDIILDKKVQEQSQKINELYNSLMKDLETAGSVQSYLLPDHLIVEKDIFFSSTYVPSTKIGGDLYDIIELSEGRYIAYIGDISGHGVKAALLMTAVKSTINRVIEDEGLEQPHEILNRLNAILSRELFSNDYMTLMLFSIDCNRRKLRFMNAGHPPLIILDPATKEVTSIAPEGAIPIGWMPSYVYTPDEEFETDFVPGFIYFIYTDGLFECENGDGEELGLVGLKEFLIEESGTHPRITSPQEIRKTLEDHHYDISSDDFTLISFSLLPDFLQQKEKRLFAGDLDDDHSLIIQKLSQYINKTSGNRKLLSAIKNHLYEWLNENLISVGITDLEKKFLGEIETDTDGSVKLYIWSQFFEKTYDDVEMNKKICSKVGNLQIEKTVVDYEDFKEICIHLKLI